MTPAQLAALVDVEFGKAQKPTNEGTVADAFAFGRGMMAGGS